MEFRNTDPGAVQYGNFINYYQFNSAQERLKLLPRDVWLPTSEPSSTSDTLKNPYLVLDVGCNSGVFTQMLWQFLCDCTGRMVHILGVDIDAVLIERAKEDNQQPSNITYATVDVTENVAFEQVKKFLYTHGKGKV